ncbi:MAG: helix-turn-helix transcriptional regulator [bacterium]
MDTGKYLRKMRKQRGLSLGEVVEKSKNQIDKTTLSRIERNERGVSLTAAYLLSKIYGEDFEDFSRKILQLRGVKLPRR